MIDLFEKKRTEWKDKISIEEEYDDYPYLIKGDVSGIQDFIFMVKSSKAAKTLKAKSFYIQVLADTCIYQLEKRLQGGTKLFYNGGGNFYLFAKENPNKAIAEVQNIINKDAKPEAFYLVLSYVERTAAEDGGSLWGRINQQSSEDKLQKFANYSDAFEEYALPISEKNGWAGFTSKLNRSKGCLAVADARGEANKVTKDKVVIFDSVYTLSEEGSLWNDKIMNKTPIWDALLKWDNGGDVQTLFDETNEELAAEEKMHRDSVIDFHMMAEIAGERTGTSKLGVLKLDIDNLGNLFRGVADLKALKKLSNGLSWFFDEFLFHLWQDKFKDNKGKTYRYRDNVYVVFAGGDDCFFVGAWDAILSFADDVQRNFDAFAKAMKAELPKALDNKTMTISGGVILVGGKYPVTRFAHLAEERLGKAKQRVNIEDKQVKNAINIFSQTLTWNEFREAKELQEALYVMIAQGTKGGKKESRAILDRIKRGGATYLKYLKGAEKGKVVAPKTWQLFYSLRNVNNKANQDFIQERIVRPYAASLMAAFMSKRGMEVKSGVKNPSTFPVAARWAEFSTKEKKQSNNQDGES